MRSLSKRATEELLRDYDVDPIGSLTIALRIVLDRPDATWEELLTTPRFSDQRRCALQRCDSMALDELVAELNEERRLCT